MSNFSKKLRSILAGLACAVLVATLSCSPGKATPQAGNGQVLPGIDVLLAEHLELVKGKRLGLITNATGLTADRRSTVDVLFEQPDVELVALFGPEHGVRGDISAGETIGQAVDAKTGLPVFSLYGSTKKPTPATLQNIDMLIFDIQDVGVRPYTYISTMAYAMQAAQENNIPIVVLDRPNPLGGLLVEGPILEEKWQSFIGVYPIPYVHGMTIGELASFFNHEFDIHADLTVIPMRGWSREQTFAQTGLVWIPTSPHVPHATTPFFLAATGTIGELQAVNEGVGYTAPFEYIGAEWIDADTLVAALNSCHLPGVFFRPAFYRPYYGGYSGRALNGVQIHILDLVEFRPIKTQVAILKTLYDLYPDHEIFNPNRLDMFYKAFGTDKIKLAIEGGQSFEEIYNMCQLGLVSYAQKREKYLLY